MNYACTSVESLENAKYNVFSEIGCWSCRNAINK